ncbi:MAG: hypothetical protein CFK52_06215 [Chloracidobacterium sp. CP2_5A]|nr:MAG: hypothetical protein CFK52_06215 [Chloracidobacterium sp. CP2_5A]
MAAVTAAGTKTSPAETEIKLCLAPTLARRLRRHPAIRQRPRTRARLRSIYFDTGDAALFQRGIALRLRRVGRRWVQAIKAGRGSGGAQSERIEWETPVPGRRLTLDALPSDAQAIIPPEVVAALAPRFETDVQRETWQIERADALIEIALDQGEARAGERAMPISEVELELKAGDVGTLFELAERLAADLPFQLEPRSKAQRGYQLTGDLALAPVKADLPTLSLDQPADAAFQRIARSCLRQFEANLPGFLAEADPDPEYVHQMRVALRRLRAAIGLLRFMGRPAPDWVGELKWLMGELAAARDWDVFVTETLPRVRASLEQPERLDGLLDAATALRHQANIRARTAVASPRLTRLWLKLSRELATLPPATLTAAEWSQAALQWRYRQVTRLGRRLETLDATGRHALRIAAKKLRYAAEFFAERHLKPARRFLRRLATLQEALGVLNDAAVTARLLDEAKQAGGSAVWEAAGLVVGFLACEQRHRLARLGRLWKRFHKAPSYWAQG